MVIVDVDSVASPTAPSKGERTRTRILAAAAEHFAAVGFEGGSVPEIARQIGVSHATLYQHFGRKDELFRAAVEADLTALFATLHPALRDPAIDAVGLVGLLADLVEASRHHPLARRVLADINVEQNAALRDSPALLDLEALLIAAIETAQANGTVRRDIEPVRFAAGMIAITLPMLVVALRLDGATDVPRAGDALAFLIDMIAPPEPDARRLRRSPKSPKSRTKATTP
jgi:AcrR family transcriptional regulator